MLVVFLIVVVGVAVAVVGWRLSDRILVPAPYGLMPEFEIVGMRDVGRNGEGESTAAASERDGSDASRVTGLVALPRQARDASQFSRTEVEGRYGLVWQGGAGLLGPVVEREDDSVVRPLTVTRGRPPRAGDPARMDVVMFHGDPSSRGLPFEDVEVPGPLGPLPGWWLPGSPTDAVLVFHGRRRADRTEALRILPLLREGGASVLVASYRNHDVAPASPDGFYHYGATEVHDARAALDWLADRGVERVALVGFSMGGAVSIELLKAWPEDGPEPVGLMLDSPLLDPATVFTRVARRTGIVGAAAATRLAVAAAGVRAGIDWSALDQRQTAPGLDLPVLLIGGSADDTVPVALLDEFAAALPGEPTYLRLDGVQHVEGWNAAPRRYEDAVAAFLYGVGMGTRAGSRND